jgi:type I site-specific restriction endonuclease
MKKVFMLVAMSIMLMASAVKAEGMNNGNAVVNSENAHVVEDAQSNADSVIYKFKLRLRDMNKAMHLDVDQIEALQQTTVDLSRRIARLENVSAEKRQAQLTHIITENLVLVHDFVNENQYRAYLSLLNNEFNRTGLNSVLYGYDVVVR